MLLARDPDGVVADGRHDHLTAARTALQRGRARLRRARAAARPGARHRRAAPGLALGHATRRPRRYDTWFFLAAAPEGEYLHDDTELIASAWIRPVDALRPATRGEVDLIFPTRKNLELLARFDTAADALAAVRGGATPDASGALRLVTDRRRAAHRAARATPRSTTEACRAQPDAAEHDARGAERAVAARAPRRAPTTRRT